MQAYSSNHSVLLLLQFSTPLSAVSLIPVSKIFRHLTMERRIICSSYLHLLFIIAVLLSLSITLALEVTRISLQDREGNPKNGSVCITTSAFSHSYYSPWKLKNFPEMPFIQDCSHSLICPCPHLELLTTPKVDLVSVGAPVETLTNVPSPGEGYDFSVRFSNEFECFGGHGVLYDCWVDPFFIGYAMPLRDFDTGRSFCRFFPHSPEHLHRSIPKSMAMSPDELVVITASVRGAFNVTGSASAYFVGGFSILNVQESLFSRKGELYLAPPFNDGNIIVVGNTDLEVYWQDMDMVVELVYLNNSGIGGLAEYRVTVYKNVPAIDKIIFKLPETGQQVEIPVRFDPDTALVLWALFLYYILLSLLFLYCK